MNNLDALNAARREAKALGIPGHQHRRLADLRDAIKAAKVEKLRAEFEGATEERGIEIVADLARLGEVVYPPGSAQYEEFSEKLRAALAQPNAFEFLDFDAEKVYQAAIEREEDEQDTPEAAAAYEAHMAKREEPRVIGTCEGCGEAIVDGQPHDEDSAGMWCEPCNAAVDGIPDVPECGSGCGVGYHIQGCKHIGAQLGINSDGTLIEADSVAVETRSSDTFGKVSMEDIKGAFESAKRFDDMVTEVLKGYRLVVNPRGNHLKMEPFGVALCGKRVPGITADAVLDQVDCLDCMDAFTQRLGK